MAPSKLSEEEKREIFELYRQPEETTSTIAKRYGVSVSTISRLLKNGLAQEEYEELVRQKRLAPRSTFSEIPGEEEDSRLAELAQSAIENPKPREFSSGDRPRDPETRPHPLADFRSASSFKPQLEPSFMETKPVPDSPVLNSAENPWSPLQDAHLEQPSRPFSDPEESLEGGEGGTLEGGRRKRRRSSVSIEAGNEAESASSQPASQLNLWEDAAAPPQGPVQEFRDTSFRERLNQERFSGERLRRGRSRRGSQAIDPTFAQEGFTEAETIVPYGETHFPELSRTGGRAGADLAGEDLSGEGMGAEIGAEIGEEMEEGMDSYLTPFVEDDFDEGEDEDEEDFAEDFGEEEFDEEDFDEEPTLGAIPFSERPLSGRSQFDRVLQVLPLSQATLPRMCYLVIDRTAELVTCPLQDFRDLGQIPPGEARNRTLPLFDNHRVARRFSKRNQRIIKVPDTRLLRKTAPWLEAKGITRLLVDGQVYALDSDDN